MMSRGKMKSLILEFYSLVEDVKFAVCSACGQKIL